MSSQVRRRSDPVSDSILYRPHQGLKALLDSTGAKPYFPTAQLALSESDC
jgi:hypothetical protein